MRTQRYSEKDLSLFLNNDDYNSFIISATDRFGDHGQIGLVIIKYESNLAILDSFMLSCRILGRHIEYWVLQSIIKIIKQKGISSLIIEYKKTERNTMVKDFLNNCEFIFLKKSKKHKKGILELTISTESNIINIDTLYG